MNSGTDIVKFVTGPTYVTYTDYTTKLREIDVVFEPIVTNPYPPVVEFLDGLSPDEDNNVYFINTTDIRMGLDPGDTGLSMDLYCYEPEKALRLLILRSMQRIRLTTTLKKLFPIPKPCGFTRSTPQTLIL